MRTCVVAKQQPRRIDASIEKAKGTDEPFLLLFGRGDKIRTCDFYVPNVALYQAEPHLDIELFFVVFENR